jgi:hypothetical protein
MQIDEIAKEQRKLTELASRAEATQCFLHYSD